MQALITIQDLEALGLDVSTTDAATKASKWIDYASAYLRQIARNNGVDLDYKITLDTATGGTFGEVVKMVVSNAVLRANSMNVEMPDASRYSQAASPYSETISFGNATPSEAFFKNKELKLLGFSSVDGRPTFGVLKGVRG